MATPIGHALAGCAAYKFSGIDSNDGGRGGRTLLGIAVAMAIAPDLDFVPGILVGQPARYHQLVTHSIGMGLAVSAVVAGSLRHAGCQSFLKIFNLCFISYLSHLVIDFFAPDGRPPYGQPLFWPVSGEYFMSPVPLFLGVHHSPSTDGGLVDWLDGVFSLHNAWAMAIEIMLIGPLNLLAAAWKPLLSKTRRG